MAVLSGCDCHTTKKGRSRAIPIKVSGFGGVFFFSNVRFMVHSDVCVQATALRSSVFFTVVLNTHGLVELRPSRRMYGGGGHSVLARDPRTEFIRLLSEHLSDRRAGDDTLQMPVVRVHPRAGASSSAR